MGGNAMTPVSYYAPGEHSSPRFAFAFAKGCGGAITDETELFDGPVALFASPARYQVIRDAQAQGRDFYYADHGYFGRKRGYYRITKNAYQHDGSGSYPPDRFLAFRREIKPWRRSGRHILICPNSGTYFGFHGLDVEHWLSTVTKTLRAHTDRELRVRWKMTRTPIAMDLQDAWAVVVFSSAAALDALIVGVPVFVTAPFAAGARLGLASLSQIESPIYPDGRERLMYALAYQQWTLPEICRGVAWRALQTRRNDAA